MKPTDTIRKNINMSNKLANWYEEKALGMGISQSSLMTVALQFYVEYQKAMDMTMDISKLIDRLEEIKDKT